MIGACEICGDETTYDLCGVCRFHGSIRKLKSFSCLPPNWEEELRNLVACTIRESIQNEVSEWDGIEVRGQVPEKRMRVQRSYAREKEAREDKEQYEKSMQYFIARVNRAKELARQHFAKRAIDSGRESYSKETVAPVSRVEGPETIHTISSPKNTSPQDTISTTESPSVGPATCTRPTPTMNHFEISLSRFEENRPLSNLRTGPTLVQSPTSTSQESPWKRCWSREEVRELLNDLYGKSEYDTC